MDIHKSDNGVEKLSSVQREYLADAEDANNQEHELTLLQAVKIYPKAVGWSLVLSTTLIMEGYDTKLVNSLFAQPAFQEAYGNQQPDGSYQISAPWQTGLMNGTTVGQIVGLLIAGYISERFGFRKTMITALIVTICFIFIQFFATGLIMLEVAQILLGIPLGMFQTVCTVYAVEVSPVCLRGYLTTYANMCWVFGQITASGVLRGVLDMPGPWAYRIPFAIQWAWPIPLIIGIYLAPESPWWLVRRNRLEEAKAAVTRLMIASNVSFDADKSVALMVITTEHEREEGEGTSYLACFKGTDLRRTIIVIACYCIQILCGNGFRDYSTYFFQQAGLPTEQSFNMSIVAYALGIVGVLLAWFMIPHIGRRTLYLWGLTWILGIFIGIGGLGIPVIYTALAWGIGGLLLLSVFIYDATVGPVAYSLVSEIPSSLLRSKSVVLARISYNVLNIINNSIVPYQLNPSAWNWGAKSGFFWAGSTLLALVFTYFCIPETKDRTTVEMDLMFERKISARKFAKTEVHVAEVI
ncbi:hypothetical protein V492_02102 [Pseudogymnoascus sp. VKM F-4246]|nr:hypothetical protein V492_02102 [Pseudogymnoascus sp. VKM F-4246]